MTAAMSFKPMSPDDFIYSEGFITLPLPEVRRHDKYSRLRIKSRKTGDWDTFTTSNPPKNAEERREEIEKLAKRLGDLCAADRHLALEEAEAIRERFNA